MKKICLMAALAALLVGCASPNPYRAPVEDRGGRAPAAEPPGSVIPVEEAPEVQVIPVGEATVIRAQRESPSPVSQTQAVPETLQLQPQSPAVVALLENARSDTGSGDLRTAQSRLERALRIAPRDPEVYIQLADVQRRQGQFLQAEQVALKGISIASGQDSALRRLWTLVAEIRNEGGNSAGAAEAHQRAAAY
ncbi:tetratricopeptide repeat protein [Marinobacterium sp. MBR-109]|jgi:cytochrome c-type biogenesis protein CcmH/NrfG|uniref:tetratricopeptide repeat protein n=1 Tax=Marinobacterium sp. MBR-109 TaxID=3156462 RepID=UPI003395D5A4